MLRHGQFWVKTSPKRRSFAPFQYSRVIWAILPDHFAFDRIPESALVGSIVTITGEGCLS
jgi:hypothetical protein